MIKIKPFLIATLLLTGFALPATAQIGEARSNLSVGVNGGVNLNSVSFTPSIKQNSLMGITGGLTARYISEKYPEEEREEALYFQRKRLFPLLDVVPTQMPDKDRQHTHWANN